MPALPRDETGHICHYPDQRLFEYTKLADAPVVPAPLEGVMLSFGETFSDDEI